MTWKDFRIEEANKEKSWFIDTDRIYNTRV